MGHDRLVDVHRPFGGAGGAGREVDERRVLGWCGGDGVGGGGAGERLVEPVMRWIAAAVLAQGSPPSSFAPAAPLSRARARSV